MAASGSERETCELAIVGGGPAGLSAATLACELGIETVLFDEQQAPGGQAYRAVEANGRADGGMAPILGKDYARGLGLVQAFRASAASYEPRSAVWQVAANGKVGISRDRKAYLTRAKRVVLATGAMERPVPLPGWTLPGVMSAGAAQTLMKASGLVPDRPVVVAGSGSLLYLVAFQLLKAGAPLQAVVDTSRHGLAAAARMAVPLSFSFSGDLLKGLSWIAAIKARRVPIYRGGNLSVEGSSCVEALSFDCDGRRRRLETGLVFLHEGIVPNNQITISLRCRHVWDAAQMSWRPETDVFGATSLALVAVAGDGAGIAGARAAVQRGRLCALDAALRLGRIGREERDARARADLAALKREARLRAFLDAAYAPTESVRRLDDDTVACRCEEVTAGDLRQLIDEGFTDLNQLKSFSRCGMGQCQGRMCAGTVARVLAEGLGTGLEDVGHYRLRIPVKPLPIAELAELGHADRDSKPALEVADGDPSQRI